MEPGEQYWAVLEPYWDAVSIYDGRAVFEEGFRALPPAIGALFAGHWCQSEVRNGGFHQFFYNSTGVLGPEAHDAYAALGMPHLAAVVREALGVLGEPYPFERQERQATLAALSRTALQRLESLDERFYEHANSEAGGWETAADRWAAGRAA
jgi:hypothetical protein